MARNEAGAPDEALPLMAVPAGPDYLAALRTAVRLRRESVM